VNPTSFYYIAAANGVLDVPAPSNNMQLGGMTTDRPKQKYYDKA
jgi:hypothetical protein